MKITEKFVASAALPREGRSQVFYFDDKMVGFGLCVAATGRRLFVAQGKIRRSGGRTRRIVLGTWPAMSVEAARAAARPILAACAAGHDPLSDRAKKPVPTMAEFIPIYLTHAKAHKRSGGKDERDLRRYLPASWRSRRLDEFTTGDMVALHTAIGERGHYVGNMFLRLLRSMLNRAADWGYLPESHLNPVRRIEWFAEHPRERFLSLEEYDKLRAALDAEPIQLWRDYFWTLVLTAQRRGEVAGMRWSELDLDAGIWTLPPDRTKADRLTRVPLTEQTLAILRARRAAAREGAEFVFPSPRNPRQPVTEPRKAFQRVLARAGLPRDLRIHDLRRSAASFAVAAGVGLPVIQKMLNHANVGTTSRVYAHLDLGSLRAALQSQHDALDARRNGFLN